jgi:tRNA dimethylallyltransferase
MSTANKYNCIVILGPTASGKTKLACRLAYDLNGEIISADSRQVYKGLDIGTGKDLDEYVVNGKNIPYHLIDIREPGEQFFLHEFAQHCDTAFKEIRSKNKLPIICGGTGLYLDALRKDFSFTQVKENDVLREELEKLSQEELLRRLSELPKEYTQHTDIRSRKRIIRAFEVATFLQQHPGRISAEARPYLPYYIGIDVDLHERKEYIASRLLKRIEMNLIEEVESLLKGGLTHERLQFLGLEYKFTSLFLKGEISLPEFHEQLKTAIFQFAKRQMTWFRKMEKEGVTINWIRKDADIDQLSETLRSLFN